MKQDLELKRSVALSCRILGNSGLADFLGHVSARVPGSERVLIRARGADAGSMLATTAKEILEVNLDGKPVQETRGLRPPLETPIHTRIYLARKDVGSVVHVHSQIPVVFSLTNTPILPIFNQGAELASEGIPVYPKNALVTTAKAGDELASTLGGKRSCILFAHGIVTVGSTVERATVTALRLRTIAQMNLFARLLGRPKVIPAEGREPRKEILESEIRGEWEYQTELLNRSRGRVD